MVDINIISLLLGGAVGSLLFYVYAFFKQRGIARAHSSADNILRNARFTIEEERKTLQNELREEQHRKRIDLELEQKRAQIELERLQHAQHKKSVTLHELEVEIHSQQERLQFKERDLAKRSDVLDADERKMRRIHDELVKKLELISAMKREEARKALMDSLEDEVRLERRQWLVKVEEETRLIAREKANRIVTGVIQRYLVDMVTMHTSSIIQLPSEDMKGRIIGKEGRNIKSLEMATGMEFIIGESPETITISGFNPMRREVAKRTLNKLILDGRINPTRIEETVEQCERELDENIVEIGQQTILEFGLLHVHPEIVKLLGRLHFRTSFTQNVLEHSKEVAHFSRMIASELGLDSQLAARCGLFHDLGKAVSAEVEGPHAIIGGDLAREYGENDTVSNAIAAHHEEVPVKTIYDIITQIADTISAARPGARRETLTTYIRRLEQLEEICAQFDGVKKSYALQAGREVRIIVNESEHDDQSAMMLARDIAKRIEGEMSFPGQIKVSVIRETRAVEYAK